MKWNDMTWKYKYVSDMLEEGFKSTKLQGVKKHNLLPSTTFLCMHWTPHILSTQNTKKYVMLD